MKLTQSIVFLASLAGGAAVAQQSPSSAGEYYRDYEPEAIIRELKRDAIADDAVMVRMRDGIGLDTDIYRPKNAKGPLPTIFWKTPYNELEMTRGSALSYALAAVRRGYAFVVQNERGRYFSEGDWQILGHPQTDGYDTLTWIAKQSWSNGKVGTLGCSSSAEWQLALAGMHHPALAAMVPMSAGAGIGKVGRFQEEGNWYTGGVPRSLFFVWLYGVENPLRAQLPPISDPAMHARVSRYNDLSFVKPKVDWPQQIKHLPVDKMLSDLGEPPGTFEQLIDRTPADPAWRQGGLYQEDMGWGVPALWFDSWYDVSIGPNLELFNHARTAGDANAAPNQYAVVAPIPHCTYWKMGPDTKVGERLMGDTSFDVDGTIFAWFDRWLKGDVNAWPASTPHVRYFNMGENHWDASDSWPPQDVKTVRMYLRSEGAANSLYGNGRLDTAAPPGSEKADHYLYDPMNPVQTLGGSDCCNGGLVTPGAYDQRSIEARSDVLVYSSEPLKEPMQVSGFVNAVLKVSSSAKDTDFAVKLVDVTPDGTAYILGDTIFRARYRNGFDKPEMMTPNSVYTIKPTPMTTSIRFDKGHRIRVEITSSDFPKFVRNLNTGGANESESVGVVANNTIHHDGKDASYIELPVVRSKP